MTAPSGRMLLAFKVRKITPFLRYLMSSVIPTQRRCFVGSSRLTASMPTVAIRKKRLYPIPSVFNRSFSFPLSRSSHLSIY